MFIVCLISLFVLSTLCSALSVFEKVSPILPILTSQVTFLKRKQRLGGDSALDGAFGTTATATEEDANLSKYEQPEEEVTPGVAPASDSEEEGIEGIDGSRDEEEVVEIKKEEEEKRSSPKKQQKGRRPGRRSPRLGGISK